MRTIPVGLALTLLLAAPVWADDDGNSDRFDLLGSNLLELRIAPLSATLVPLAALPEVGPDADPGVSTPPLRGSKNATNAELDPATNDF